MTRANRQGQDERAFDEALSLPVELRRMPLMLSAATFTGRTYGGQKPTPSQLSLRWGAFRISQLLFQTEDGETPVAGAIVNVGHNFAMTIPDEPMRPWRQLAELYADDTWSNPRLLGIAVRHFGRAGRLTDTDFTLVRSNVNALTYLGRTREAQDVVQELGDRFRGDWYRLQFEEQQIHQLVDGPARVAGVDRLRAGWGDRWTLRVLLAQTQAMNDELAAVARTLETWPDFDGNAESPPVQANHALIAASLLLGLGNESAARLMAERATAYQSGAASENTARRVVATLDRRWNDAADAEVRTYDTYRSDGTLSRAAWYARVGGNTIRAALLRRRAVSDELGITGRAFAADLQIEGATPEKVLSTVDAFADIGIPDEDALFRSRFLFSSLAIDRELGPALSNAVRKRLGQDPYGRLLQLFAAREHAASHRFSALVDLLEPGFGGVRAKPAHQQLLGTGYLLPYLALGLLETGRAQDVPPLLAVWRQRTGGIDPYERAATAALEASAGHHDLAVRALWHGYVVTPDDEATSMPPQLLLLEIAEHWYQRTHDDRYRAFMAKIARLTENTDPYPWAYAFEARYTNDPARRIEAAAATLYLDPLSMRLAALPPDVIDAARRLLATSNPMLAQR